MDPYEIPLRGEVIKMRKKEKIIAWLRLARLQFQPPYFISYSIGAAAAYATYQVFNVGVYVLGLIVTSLGVICAAVVNDYYDYPTDRVNTKRGTFNAGSGVLVEGKLGFNEVKIGISVILGLILVFGFLLIDAAQDVSALLIVCFGLLGIFLLLEYSAPPLKFSYKGMGEIVMSIMGGPYPILLGYFVQIGTWSDSLPWLLSIPLFLAALTAGAIGSIPDYHADMQVLRKRFAVIFGPRLTAIMSLGLISITALSEISLWYFGILTGLGSLTVFIVIPYSLILGFGIIKLIQTEDYERKIERVFKLALFNILLIGLIPLLALLWR
jgi:1,4-dihydroxy-2-naphthoate octaprenyltransferase